MHKIGLALGLANNNNSSSVMYRYTGLINIASSDVNDIKSLYN